jgi:hypothetical protein
LCDLEDLTECVQSSLDALTRASEWVNSVLTFDFSNIITSLNIESYLQCLEDYTSKLESYADDPDVLVESTTEDTILYIIDGLEEILQNAFSPISDYIGPVFTDYMEKAINQLKYIPQNVFIQDTHAKLDDLDVGTISKKLLVSEAATTELIRALGSNPIEWFSLGSRRFEEILAEIWSGLGWVTVLTPPTQDGGFDIRAVKDEYGMILCYLIEAKAYKPDKKVGIDVVRKLYGVVEREKASHGIIATTSRFTKGAIKEAKALQYRVSLADFCRIQEWIKAYKALQS